MHNLTTQRCFNHATREAVARCPECRGFFCRECVTEHDDRVICSACLQRLARVPLLKRPMFAAILRGGQAVLGLLVVWFFFYLIGAGLASLPNSFHEQELWRVRWIDRE